MTDADKLATALAEVKRLNAQNHQLRLQVNGLHDELAEAERQSLEWQAALHHAETEARQCGFTGSIREPGPALLAILQARDEALDLVGSAREELVETRARADAWRRALAENRHLFVRELSIWLNDQIAAELESWRVARAIKPESVVEVDDRIAELRRKEKT